VIFALYRRSSTTRHARKGVAEVLVLSSATGQPPDQPAFRRENTRFDNLAQGVSAPF